MSQERGACQGAGERLDAIALPATMVSRHAAKPTAAMSLTFEDEQRPDDGAGEHRYHGEQAADDRKLVVLMQVGGDAGQGHGEHRRREIEDLELTHGRVL